MGLVDKLRGFVKQALSDVQWTKTVDDARSGAEVHVWRTTSGDYIVKDEGDGTWSWVKTSPMEGDIMDLRVDFKTLEAAKESAEEHFREG